MDNTLFLILEGVLQSWGEHSRWDDRDTSDEPTKSGVVGLLGCALGVSNAEQLSKLSQKLTIGVRADRPGIKMEDYQVVSGGTRKADGGVRGSGVVTSKYYLYDACFVVALKADPDTINTIKNALLDPVWILFLGRKGCTPVTPVFGGTGEYESVEQALLAFPLSERTDSTEKVRLVLESDQFGGHTRSDEIIGTDPRVFGRRYVRYVYLDKKEFRSSHDPISIES